MCILCVCILLKVVSHYDLSVLSISVMGFQKRLYREVVRGISFIFLEFLTLQSP